MLLSDILGTIRRNPLSDDKFIEKSGFYFYQKLRKDIIYYNYIIYKNSKTIYY